MATSSEVKAALDDIAQSIRTERQALKNAKARITAGNNNLGSIPTTFSDALATINAFSSSDPFEVLAQDELVKMTIEFQALRAEASNAVTALESITEF